jgi:hypothetical protein
LNDAFCFFVLNAAFYYSHTREAMNSKSHAEFMSMAVGGGGAGPRGARWPAMGHCHQREGEHPLILKTSLHIYTVLHTNFCMESVPKMREDRPCHGKFKK